MSNDDGHGKDSGKRKSGGMNIDTALVRELAELLNETGLTEIEVEDDDRKIRVSRGAVASAAPVYAAAPAPIAAAAAPAAAAPAPAEPAAPAGPDLKNAVKSPMVGTCYHSPAPGSAPFVTVGQQVKEGQTANFAVDAFPGRTFPATISRVDLGSNLSSQSSSSTSRSPYRWSARIARRMAAAAWPPSASRMVKPRISSRKRTTSRLV